MEPAALWCVCNDSHAPTSLRLLTPSSWLQMSTTARAHWIAAIATAPQPQRQAVLIIIQHLRRTRARCWAHRVAASQRRRAQPISPATAGSRHEHSIPQHHFAAVTSDVPAVQQTVPHLRPISVQCKLSV